MADLTQSKLMHMFIVPFLSHEWDDCEELNKELKSSILAQEKLSPGQNKSNVGGWQSTEDLHRWAGPAGERLVGMITEMVNSATSKMFAHFGVKDEFSWNMAIWANINRKGEYNLLHIHAGSTWSGVYYVDTGSVAREGPAHGAITFHNPILAQSFGFFTKAVPNDVTLRPKAGQMVVFPSYLQHQVLPHHGDSPRISIAFNVRKNPFP